MRVSISSPKPNIGKIEFEYYEPLMQLREHFSIFERNFAYIRRCKAKHIRVQPDKEIIQKSCIKRTGEFELGMLPDIIKYIQSKFCDRTVNLAIDEKIGKIIKTNTLKLDPNVFINESGQKPRDYQIESMQIALNKQGGIYILGTGAGKTVCSALLIHNILKNKLAKKVFFLCPFPDLANQTCNDIERHLKDHGYTFSKWFGKEKVDFNADIIVAASAILRSQYDDYEKELKKIDCIIVDEVHQLKLNNKISDIIAEMPAKLRYGFTGTLPDDKLDQWSIIGKIGPVRYRLGSSDLRKNKFLTDVRAFGIKVDVNDVPVAITPEGEDSARPLTYMEEVEWLSNSNDLNTAVCKIVGILENNTLILTKRIVHGEELIRMCKEMYPNKKVYYINGEVDLDERGEIKREMEESDNLVVVAQVATFSTGINVKNIHNIIFPGVFDRSYVQTTQSIGRGLRLNGNKTKLKVIDVIPNTKYSTRHSEDRQKIYQRENIPFSIIKLKSK